MGKHLTYSDRVKIEVLLKAKKSRAEIADIMGVSVRTVYYELKRGQYEKLDHATWKTVKSYSPDIAQAAHDRAATSKGKPIKLGNSYAFAAYVERKIKQEKYSPRAALAAAKAESLDFGFTVSHTTLYAWIHKGYLNIGKKHLPEKTRHKNKAVKKTISYRHPYEKSIENRPREVADRLTFGHWEMDTVQGKKEGKQHCLLVLTERKTKMELVRKLQSKTAAAVVRVLDGLQKDYGPIFSAVFKSITCDNGSEFADYEGMERDGRTTVYYCHPYASCERGQNENANKLVRRWIPKGQSINRYSRAYVQHLEDWMNDYPRQKLGWKTPRELYAQELACLFV